jgi:hypothetical protein
MVGLLWLQGQLSAAVRLEQLWNELLEASDVSLYCAYPIDVLGPDFHHASVDPLLCSHTHLVGTEPTLESSLNRAMDEVLGGRVDGLRNLIQSNHRPAWGEVPKAEAIILWLRHNLPGSAEKIIQRTREYQQLASSG